MSRPRDCVNTIEKSAIPFGQGQEDLILCVTHGHLLFLFSFTLQPISRGYPWVTMKFDMIIQASRSWKTVGLTLSDVQYKRLNSSQNKHRQIDHYAEA